MENSEPRKAPPRKKGYPNVRKTYRFAIAREQSANGSSDASSVSKAKIVQDLVARKQSASEDPAFVSATEIPGNISVNTLWQRKQSVNKHAASTRQIPTKKPAASIYFSEEGSVVSRKKLARSQRPNLVSRKPNASPGKKAPKKQVAPISLTEFVRKRLVPGKEVINLTIGSDDES